MSYDKEKSCFSRDLKAFADSLASHISKNDEWNIRGFIDIFKNVYTISSDTKIVSKVLELHLFPQFLFLPKELVIKSNLPHIRTGIQT